MALPRKKSIDWDSMDGKDELFTALLSGFKMQTHSHCFNTMMGDVLLLSQRIFISCRNLKHWLLMCVLYIHLIVYPMCLVYSCNHLHMHPSVQPSIHSTIQPSIHSSVHPFISIHLFHFTFTYSIHPSIHPLIQ